MRTVNFETNSNNESWYCGTLQSDTVFIQIQYGKCDCVRMDTLENVTAIYYYYYYYKK